MDVQAAAGRGLQLPKAAPIDRSQTLRASQGELLLLVRTSRYRTVPSACWTVESGPRSDSAGSCSACRESCAKVSLTSVHNNQETDSVCIVPRLDALRRRIMDTDTVNSQSVQCRDPRVVIEYCKQCRWMLRAAWYAQELLTTFQDQLGEVALQPSSGGRFFVTLHTAGGSTLIWDRKERGGFPGEYLTTRLGTLDGW